MQENDTNKKRINISKPEWDQIASHQYLSKDQSENLWKDLASKEVSQTALGTTVSYYFGALLVISAMSWLMTLGWSVFGGLGVFCIAGIYGIIFYAMGYRLWQQDFTKLPGGLLATMAVCMVPLAMYGLEWEMQPHQDGVQPVRDFYISGRTGLWAGIPTVTAGLFALKYIRFPFLMAPIAFALWGFVYDFSFFFLGKSHEGWDQFSWISMAFGIAMCVSAYFVEKRTNKDYAYWLYFVGVFAFWAGLTGLNIWDNEWQLFIYALVNLGLIALSVVLDRKVFMVFGGFGVIAYLSHLAYTIFENSILFPFVLTLIGLGVIAVTIYLNRRGKR